MNRLHRLARHAIAAFTLAGTLAAAEAATVTYTFTEFDDAGQVVWQLRHQLADFLDPDSFETAHFTLADVVVDPWQASGWTTLEIDEAGFSALPGYVTFNGVYFCNGHFVPPGESACSYGDRFIGSSFDLHVDDRSAGTWRAGNTQLEVAIDAGTPPGTVDAPGSATLAALALGLLAGTRTRRR